MMITQEHYFNLNQHPKPSPKTSTEHPEWQSHCLLSCHICCSHLTCMRFVQFGSTMKNIVWPMKLSINSIYSTLIYSFIWVHCNGSHTHPLCTSRRDLLVILDHWVPFQLSLNAFYAHLHLIYSKGQIKL